MRGLLIVPLSIMLAGCFNPNIKNGGFACDPTQSPACPSGFVCVNNRCMNAVGASGDLGLGNGGVGGNGGDSFDLSAAPDDLSRTHHMRDFATGGGGFGGGGGGGGGGSGGGSCAHAICTSGTRLQSSCDPCVTQICAMDAYCCNTRWDSSCVGEVSSICGQSCP
jgi:hypothetical protein